MVTPADVLPVGSVDGIGDTADNEYMYSYPRAGAGEAAFQLIVAVVKPMPVVGKLVGFPLQGKATTVKV